MRILTLVLISLFVFLFGCQAPEQPQQQFVRIPADLLTQEFVRQTGFVRDSKQDDVFAFGYVSVANLPQNVASQITVLDESALREFAFDAKTLETYQELPSAATYEDYHNYDALTAELKKLAENPLVTLKSAGKSVKGRELWYVTITKPSDVVKPKLLYIANMHGDEAVGREMMIYLSRLLLTQYGKDPQITRIVDGSEVYIMPSMNPDGFELKQRSNANYVDLNRDFPDFTSDPHDTAGGRAVETGLIMGITDRFQLALNFHGGAVCFNLPWDSTPNTQNNKFADDSIIYTLGRSFADLNPTMQANSGGSFDRGVTYGYEWYEVDGGMQDWSVFYRDQIHATVELSGAKWPTASSLPSYWNENKVALLGYLEAGLMGLHLQIVGPTANIKVEVWGLKPLTYSSNIIHRVTLLGSKTVKLSSPGFADVSLTLPAAAFDGTFQTVIMNPVK